MPRRILVSSGHGAFADEMVAEMENHGKWAGVNVPFAPRIISMESIGFADTWDHFLQQYIQPLQQRTSEGYWKVKRNKLTLSKHVD